MQMTSTGKARAVGWLLLATTIWGAGFPATQVLLEAMHPLWANAVRFWLGLAFSIALFWKRLPTQRTVWLSLAPTAAMLTGAFALQTWGLAYTTVARSSLITGLYAVLVPLMAPLMGAHRPLVSQWAAAALALLGLGVLTGVWTPGAAGGAALNMGDALTLGCAFFCAMHVLRVGRVAAAWDPLAFNTVQLGWCAVLSTVLAAAFGGAPPQSLPLRLWGPLLFVALVSGVVAFGAQVAAQRTLSATSAATLMLLEAPMGVFFGVVLLADPVSSSAVAGGALILAGAAASVRAEAHIPAPVTTG